jgi:hypothetical protein
LVGVVYVFLVPCALGASGMGLPVARRVIFRASGTVMFLFVKSMNMSQVMRQPDKGVRSAEDADQRDEVNQRGNGERPDDVQIDAVRVDTSRFTTWLLSQIRF